MLIDWFTVAAQAMNFLILVWLLQRFLYKPVLAAIDARERKIAEELQSAAMAKAQAQSERDALQLQTLNAGKMSIEVLQKAAAESAVQRQQLLDAAVRDSQSLRTKLNQAVNDERAQLDSEILRRMRDEVFAITRKALEQMADVKLEERIVDLFIERVRDMDARSGPQPGAAPALLSAESAAARQQDAPALLRSAFELSQPQRTLIEAAVSKWMPAGARLNFVTAPELIGGLELTASGQRISWNLMDYLATLTQNVNHLLEPKDTTVTTVSTPPIQHAA